MKDTVADYQKNVQTWFWSLDIKYYSQLYIYNTAATTSLQLPNVFKANHYNWNLLQATSTRKRPGPLLGLKVWNFLLFFNSRKRPLNIY